MNNSWISQVVASTIEAESPERFQYWSAVSALSAVVKKNLHLNRYYYKLYPNTYVFLVAKSGLRKSNPVTLAKKIVVESEATRVILGRNSIQSVLKELGKAHSLEGGGILKDASGFLVSGELASFLVKDPEALTILTDLYDTHACEPEWRNTLKTQGTDILKNVCLTLLGATNEEHFKAAVPADAIGGGFIARTLIVLESKRRVINDLMDAPQIVPDVKSLVCYLKEVAKLTGEFTLHKEAKAMYRNWYHELARTEHTDTTGSIERLGDTVLKVAMLISLSYELSLEIKPLHMHEAISRCIECLDGLQQVTMGAGGKKSNSQEETALVMRDLIKRPGHQATRKQLLAKFWGQMDSLVLDKVIETMAGAGAIDVWRDGKETIYKMTDSTVQLYTQFKQEIN